jgi:hypothetical protein
MLMQYPRIVIAGLDPAIHPLLKRLLRRRWMRGSSPRMTSLPRTCHLLRGSALPRRAPQDDGIGLGVSHAIPNNLSRSRGRIRSEACLPMRLEQ